MLPANTIIQLQQIVGWCLYTSHGSVSVFNVGIGIRYRYIKISRYRFGISVFQLVHVKGHG